MPAIRCDSNPRDANPQQAAYPPRLTAVTTAANGRYIRCSAMTCVATGTMLDVGARIAKNHAPRKPIFGHRQRATSVVNPNSTTSIASGTISSVIGTVSRP